MPEAAGRATIKPFFAKRYHPAGTAPGTLSHARHADLLPPRLRLFTYNATDLQVNDNADVDQCRRALQDAKSITWVHVEGHPDESLFQQLGDLFSLHPLALEDVLNSGQRPKIERFDDQLFLVMCLPVIIEEIIDVWQVSLFVGDNFVVSFCSGDFTSFKPIARRLHSTGRQLRDRGADYLAYSLIDLIVDQGFPTLEKLGMQLETLEEQLLRKPDEETLAQIYTMRRELILLRRSLWPHRDVINELLRDEIKVIKKGTLYYLRDCYDHTIQIMELLETYRDMSGSMLEIYLSGVSNRMNEVMRVLTVIATIFIPLTFIVGVYGMNFDRSAGPWSMPELGLPYGYALIWLVMIVVAIGMVVYFRRRKWF